MIHNILLNVHPGSSLSGGSVLEEVCWGGESKETPKEGVIVWMAVQKKRGLKASQQRQRVPARGVRRERTRKRTTSPRMDHFTYLTVVRNHRPMRSRLECFPEGDLSNTVCSRPEACGPRATRSLVRQPILHCVDRARCGGCEPRFLVRINHLAGK